MNRADRLPLANFAVAIVAFGIAAAMAMMQALSRASLDLPFRSPKMYYLSVTAHGVLMALVFTTFFIMGFGYLVATRTLSRPIATPRLAWTGFWVALTGTTLAAGAILSGRAGVLYTFYPPLQAHPAFYIGAALLIVGSWCWSLVVPVKGSSLGLRARFLMVRVNLCPITVRTSEHLHRGASSCCMSPGCHSRC